MPLTPEQIKTMLLVDKDKVFWDRQGGSKEYRENTDTLKDLLKIAYIFWTYDGCCTKEFFLTKDGKQALDSEMERA